MSSLTFYLRNDNGNVVIESSTDESYIDTSKGFVRRLPEVTADICKNGIPQELIDKLQSEIAA